MFFIKKTSILKGLITYLYLTLLFTLSCSGKSNTLTLTFADSLEVIIENSTGIKQIEHLHELSLHYIYTDHQKAQDLAKQAVTLSIEQQHDSLLSYSYYYVGATYYYQSNWRTAIDNFNKSVQTKWGKESLTLQTRCNSFIGICYKRLGDFEQSINSYLKAIQTSEELNDSLQTARTQQNLGALYMRMNDYELARNLLLSSLHVFVNTQQDDDIINVYHNLFITEGELGYPDKSKLYFENATKIAEERKDTIKLASLYGDYGNLLINFEDYSSAKVVLTKALSFSDTNARAITYYLVYKSLGICNMYQNNIEEAEYQMQYALKHLKDAEFALTNLYLHLSRLYARKGQYELSEQYSDSALAVEQKLFTDKRIKAISEMEVTYDTQKKEKELEILDLKLTTQKRKLYFILVISLLLFFTLLTVIWFNRRIKRKNIVLFKKNLELSEQWERLQRGKEGALTANTKNPVYQKIVKVMVEDQVFTNSELNVSMLAKLIQSNTKYVSTAIKEQTGLNFNAYVHTFRIEAAKSFLLDKKKKAWSLDSIALECGYKNPSTFYQIFKQKTGLTPSKYRNISTIKNLKQDHTTE